MKHELTWIENFTGGYHLFGQCPNSMVVGFAQDDSEIKERFFALIIRRAPVGKEPEIVELAADDTSFYVVARHTGWCPSHELFNDAHDALIQCLPRMASQWTEWKGFVRKLLDEAITEAVQLGLVSASFQTFEA